MIATSFKSRINQGVRPLAAAIVRMGIHPSVITVGIPFVMAVVCWVFLKTRSVGPFCLAALLVGLLDGIDGAVARIGGQVSAFGAYLDALCDRYVDALVTITVAAATGYWVLSMVFLAGSFLVSYAKTRAAMEVKIANTEWPDLMERGERDVSFLIGLAAGAYIPLRPLGHDLFWWTLVVLCVLVHLTVIQRMMRAARFIQNRA